MNDLDNELSRTMRRHAENLSPTPLAFDDVRGKATSIRRRRQLATGVGIAAAVAVIVPTAMFATQSVRADDSTPPANSATPTVVDSNGTEGTEGPGPTMGADPGALDVSDLPTGAEPGVSLVTDGLASVEVDGATVRWTQSGVVVEADGQSYGPYPTSFGLVPNSAATAVAWTTDQGEVMIWAKGDGEPRVLLSSELVSLEVGAISGTFCTPGEASDCLVYVSGYDMATNTDEPFTVDANGEVGRIDPAGTLLNVHDVTDDGRLIGHTEITDFDSCSALIDRDSGSKPLWKTCSHTLDTFSPGGSLVLGSENYHDGLGSGQIAIFDAATGDLLVDRIRRDGDGAIYNSAVWEDETHVLFSAYQDGQWSMVRMDVTGAMEYAIEPQKGNAERVPWRFETT